MKKNKASKKLFTYIISLILLLLAFLVSLEIGSSGISFLNFILSGGEDVEKNIIHIRLSQTLAVLISGISLSISGFVLQRITRNNLVDPGITGVLSGSALGITLLSFISINVVGLISVFRIVFSIVFGILVSSLLIITSIIYKDSLKVILFGVMINSFISGVIVLIQSLLDPYKLHQTFSFLIGSVSIPSEEFIILGILILIFSIIAILSFSNKLDVISLGEIDAQVLGVDIRIWRTIFFVIAALISGIAVSFTGIIGFVGFIIPNLVNIISYRYTSFTTKDSIIFTGILGGSFLLVCFTISKILLPFYDLPLGVITGLIGAPIFSFVILRLNQR